MTFEIREVIEDDEIVSDYALSYLLYPDLHVSDALAKVHDEHERMEEHEEFWSDPCWSE